jgi:N-methylhydantoinase B
MDNMGEKRVVIDLVRAKYASAREELESLIERTAMSPVIREKKDYFVAFFTESGQFISGTTYPLGAGALEAVTARFPLAEMEEGDVYVYNSPYGSAGGVSHAPDLVVIRPAFVGSKLVGLVQVFGHLWDIGGIAAGSVVPSAREIYHEGLLVPPVRLGTNGELSDDIIRILLENTRFPEMLEGDLRALVAACELGERRLIEIALQFGFEEMSNANLAIIAQGKAIAQKGFAAIPEGRYEFIERIDSGTGEPVYVDLALIRTKNSVVVDARGTSDQVPQPINFLMHPSVLGMMYGMYFMAHEPSAALNAGMLDAIDEVLLRDGSLLAPNHPAPLGMRGITWIHTNSAVFGTLALATNGQAPAATPSYVIYYLRGFDKGTSRPIFLMDGLAVGYGARPWSDGLNAIYYTAQENFPVEFLESLWPVRILEYSVHRDSGGPGRYRGGLGIVRRIEVLIDGLEFSSRVNNVKYPAWGSAGGLEGRPGRVVLNPGSERQRVLEPIAENVLLSAGDIVEVCTSGGGGWGDPRLREADEVLRDFEDGFVSRESARDDYGVVIDPHSVAIDQPATNELRAGMPVPTGAFHQNGKTSEGDWGIEPPHTRRPDSTVAKGVPG